MDVAHFGIIFANIFKQFRTQVASDSLNPPKKTKRVSYPEKKVQSNQIYVWSFIKMTVTADLCNF